MINLRRGCYRSGKGSCPCDKCATVYDGQENQTIAEDIFSNMSGEDLKEMICLNTELGDLIINHIQEHLTEQDIVKYFQFDEE